MITLNANRTIAINKTADVKYVARLSNYDKKYVFKRDFINTKTIDTHDGNTVLEVAMKDGKKDYYLVEVKANIITKVDYDELKKLAKDKLEFGSKYDFGMSI